MKTFIVLFSFLFFSLFTIKEKNIANHALYRLYFGESKYYNAYKKADSILKKDKNNIPANIIKADYVLYQGNTDDAIDYISNVKKALKEGKISPVNQYMYHYIEANLGIYNHDYYGRLNHYIQSKKIKEKYHIVDPYFLTEENIIFFYLDQKNYSKTFPIIDDILLQLEEDDIVYHPLKSTLFRAKSISLRETQHYMQSQTCLDLAMMHALHYHDSTQISRIFRYQSELYFAEKDYKRSLETTLKAQILFQQYDTKNIIVIYELLGKLYYELGDYKKAKYYLEKVVQYNPYIYNLEIFETASNLYQEILIKEGNIEAAYTILKNKTTLQQQISGDKIDNQILDLELDYHDFKNQTIEKRSHNQINKFLNLLFLSLISISSLSFLFYRRFSNIKNLKSRQKTIKKTHSELKQAYLKLQRFGVIISQDFEKPIHSIEKGIQFIEKEETDISHNSKKHIKLIHQSIVTLKDFIFNLLILSKSENNLIEKVKIDFTDLIEKVKINLLYDIKRNNAQIIVKNKAQYLYGNESLLIQLFQNIIQNMIKYKDRSQPLIIELDYIASEKKVTLQDNGIGIKPEHINNLFEFYHQESFDKDLELDLYITKIISDLHHITISIQPTKNQGALIELSFQNNDIT